MRLILCLFKSLVMIYEMFENRKPLGLAIRMIYAPAYAAFDYYRALIPILDHFW